MKLRTDYISWSDAHIKANGGFPWAIYLTCHNARKNQEKFYEVVGEGFNITHIRNGRIGTEGRYQRNRDWHYAREKIWEKLYKKGYSEFVSPVQAPAKPKPKPAPVPYSMIRFLIQERDCWIAQDETYQTLFKLPDHSAKEILDANTSKKLSSRSSRDLASVYEITPPVLL